MYLAYQAVRYVAPIALTPFLAHTLGKSRFADLVILNSCIWTSTVFMEFGFYLYGINKTAAATDEQELSRTVTAISAAKALLAPVALLAYLGLAAWAGLLFREPFTVALGAFSALGYGASFAWFFQGQERGGLAVTTEAIPQLIYYAVIFLVVRTPADFTLAVAAQTIPPVVSLIVALILIRRTVPFGRFEFAVVRKTLSEALPYFVERFCFTLYTAISPTLIAVLSIHSEASYYSIGDRVGIFLATITTPFFQAATPAVTRAVGQNRGGWSLSLRVVAGVTLAVAASASVAYLCVPFVIQKLFTPDYLPAIKVARLFCVIAVISVFGMSLANFVLIPRQAARIMIWSSSLALIVGLFVQWMLVPHYGAIGSALSRGLSESIVAVVLASAAVRLFYRELKQKSACFHYSDSSSPEALASKSWEAIHPDANAGAMESRPAVSIVMPVFNGEKYLEGSLESVFAQTFQNFELIVIDDGSTDRTPEILQSHSGDPRLLVLTLPHAGICAALNAGMQHAKAEYIARIDADDLMMPNRLERQLQFLSEQPSLAGAASEYHIIDEAGQKRGYKKIPLYTAKQVLDCLSAGSELIFPHPTMIFRRSVALSLGGYRRQYEKCEDVDLFLRMIQQGNSIIVQPEALTQFRYHGASVSANNTRQQFHLKRLIFGNHRRQASGNRPLEVKEYFDQLQYQSFLWTWMIELQVQSDILIRKAAIASLRGRSISSWTLILLAAFLNPGASFRKVWRKAKRPNFVDQSDLDAVIITRP